MTSRLAVTREQATALFADSPGRMLDVTLRLPERPTMPCPHTLHIHAVPIPEGTRVEVGWWEHGDDTLGCWMKWHPVAFATLTEARKHLHDDGLFGWTVILTNLTPTEDQSDG